MDSSFSLVRVKTDIQDLMLCSRAKEGTISEQLTMYCMLALSIPHCPGHIVYTHHTQPMQGPGGALRCLEVHVIRCTAYLEAASPPCPLPIRCSTVSEVRVYTVSRGIPLDGVNVLHSNHPVTAR